MWLTLIQVYWQLTLFRKGPEDTPCSHFLFVLLAVIFYIVLILQTSIVSAPPHFSFLTAIWSGIGVVLSYIFYTALILRLRRFTNRFLQTICALFASHILIHLFAFPLLMTIPMIEVQSLPQILALLIGILYFSFTVILTVWQFSITVHIYKRSLEIDYLPAILAAVGLIACTLLMMTIW